MPWKSGESHLHSQVGSCKGKYFAQGTGVWARPQKDRPKLGESDTAQTPNGRTRAYRGVWHDLKDQNRSRRFLDLALDPRNWRAEFLIGSIGKTDVTGEKLAPVRNKTAVGWGHNWLGCLFLHDSFPQCRRPTRRHSRGRSQGYDRYQFAVSAATLDTVNHHI